MNFWSILKMMIQAIFSPRRNIQMSEIPQGLVLDIGGGGEGVIARVGGPGIIAIDRYMSEIQEARDKAPGVNWMVADGTNLPHPDNCMDHATAFFSCMYMSDDVKVKVFCETQRVLKGSGEFWIWDVPMTTKSGTFACRLQVESPGIPPIRTLYGVQAKDQSAEKICRHLQQAGFETDLITSNEQSFFVKAKNS